MPRTSRSKFNYLFQDALNVKNVYKKNGILNFEVEEEEKGEGRKKIRAGGGVSGDVSVLKSFDLRV